MGYAGVYATTRYYIVRMASSAERSSAGELRPWRLRQRDRARHDSTRVARCAAPRRVLDCNCYKLRINHKIRAADLRKYASIAPSLHAKWPTSPMGTVGSSPTGPESKQVATQRVARLSLEHGVTIKMQHAGNSVTDQIK